jgi:hypothetical protein
MVSKKLSVLLASIFLSALVSGCAHPYRFKNAVPITSANDTKPSPVPGKSDFNFVEYSINSSVRYPVHDMLDTRRISRSQDVNSFDELPTSAWFTPRLGKVDISEEALVKGAEEKGPPQAPLLVVAAKTKGNSPGFIIKDSRGLKYLIKLDQFDYPAVESTANFVVNRLYWGFGYNVPEDFIIQISPTELKVEGDVNQEDVEKVLMFAYADDDGSYRAVASRFLEGTILGPISPKGTRKGDPNDTIPHQNRRALRALRMFSAWLDNSGIRSDNSLDVYVGEHGKGHTVHYLVDFGEALGVHGIEKNRAWDGFEHFFSLSDTARNFATLGFPIKKWEHLKMESNDLRGNFEANAFDPRTWKESVQFLPMQLSLPDDDYWAAKIIAATTPEHLEALFKAANHPDESYTKYILETLSKRREKILRYAFSRVSPLEFASIENGALHLRDLGHGQQGLNSSGYKVRFLSARGRKIAKDLTLPVLSGKELEVPFTDALAKTNGYLIVEITVLRNGKPAPRAAQFHIRMHEGTPLLSGIVH